MWLDRTCRGGLLLCASVTRRLGASGGARAGTHPTAPPGPACLPPSPRMPDSEGHRHRTPRRLCPACCEGPKAGASSCPLASVSPGPRLKNNVLTENGASGVGCILAFMRSPRGGRELFRRIAVIPRAAVTCAVAGLHEIEKPSTHPERAGAGAWLSLPKTAQGLSTRISLYSPNESVGMIRASHREKLVRLSGSTGRVSWV